MTASQIALPVPGHEANFPPASQAMTSIIDLFRLNAALTFEHLYACATAVYCGRVGGFPLMGDGKTGAVLGKE